MIRALLVAAHPDDETLGAGGTVARWAKSGAEIAVLVLTRCAVDRYDVTSEEATTRRRNECRVAAKILGIADVRLLDFAEIQLAVQPISTVIDMIRAVVEEVQPDTVLTHWAGDLNQDHRVASEATMVACRPFTSPFVRRVWAYQVDALWVPGMPFVPNVYVDIEDTLLTKLDALDAYRSEVRQFPHPRSRRAVEGLAKMLGAKSGLQAAEGFVQMWGRE